MKEPSLEKMDAIQAMRNLLLEVLECASDSERFETVIDLLDQIDEYLQYIEGLEELESLEIPKEHRLQSGLVYHLMKKHRQSQKQKKS